MPALSMFYGIIVRMQSEKGGRHHKPHIHAIYGEDVAAIDIQTCKVIEGELPKKAMELVVEWITIYQKDLMEIWETQNFKKLPPLE